MRLLSADTPQPHAQSRLAAFFCIRLNSRVYGLALRAGFSRHWRNVTKSFQERVRHLAIAVLERPRHPMAEADGDRDHMAVSAEAA